MEKSGNLDINQFVVFKLGKEDYGININKVSTIEQVLPATRVPNTPDYIRGVINLRGDVIPVMDLRKRVGLPPVEDTEDTRIIIIKSGEVCAGIIVDSVSEVMYLDDNSVENASNFISEDSTGYIIGAGKAGDRIVSLLDADKIMVLE